jgi:integrase
MYSTGHHIAPTGWDKKRERAKDNRPLNTFLDSLVDLIKGFMDARHDAKTLSRAFLKEHIIKSLRDEQQDQEEQEENELFKTWQQIIDTTKTKHGKLIKHDTKRQKVQTKKLVEKYAKEKHLKLSFSTMDIKFYHALDLYMIGLNMNGNTRGKIFKDIKAVMREAAERDIPVSNAYLKKAWKIIKEDAETVFLNTAEIRKIFDCDKIEGENIVHRDIFVMACFVGARHSDWKHIRKENIIQENGRDILRYRQTKTGDIVHVPVHSAVKSILAKYDTAPKVITNQNFNKALKDIAQAAELGNVVINGKVVEKWKHISTHTARRSFATNAYLSKSMDVLNIMRCTGHKTESAFLKYLKLDGRDYAAMAAESKFFTEGWSILKTA